MAEVQHTPSPLSRDQETISTEKLSSISLHCRLGRRWKVTRTASLYLGFLCLGMTSNITGPTLLELQRLTDTTTEAISWLFPIRAAVGLSGAVLCGALIDKFNHWTLLSLMMADAALCHFLIPYMYTFTSLSIVSSISRIGTTFFVTGGNLVLLWIWGADNGPWMQALHCMFGFGAFLAPLIAEPFLSDIPGGFESQSIKSSSNNSSSEDHRGAFPTAQLTPENGSVIGHNITDTGNIKDESLVHWVYMILSIFAIISSIFFLSIALFCSERKLHCKNKFRKDSNPNNASVQNVCHEKEDRAFRIQIIVLVFWFYILYLPLEVNFSNYLTIFAVKELGWSEAEGAQVTSGFWATFTAGRVLGIIVIKLLAPWVMLAGSLIVTVCSLGVLLFSFHFHYMVLWGCSLSVGLGLSTMYATGITWTEQYITVTGPAGASFMIGGAIGEMVGPVLVGFLFETFGPKSFLYVVAGAALVLALLFVVMQCHAGRHGKRGKKQPSAKPCDNQIMQSTSL